MVVALQLLGEDKLDAVATGLKAFQQLRSARAVELEHARGPTGAVVCAWAARGTVPASTMPSDSATHSALLREWRELARPTSDFQWPASAPLRHRMQW